MRGLLQEPRDSLEYETRGAMPPHRQATSCFEDVYRPMKSRSPGPKLLVLLVTAVVFGLCSCGGRPSVEPEGPPTVEVVIPSSSEEHRSELAPSSMAETAVEPKRQPPICSEDGWCWHNPLPQGHPPSSVWGSGPKDVFA